jgi:xylulose-5-phosphate/fructose-6-phosphate phosphoketolase
LIHRLTYHRKNHRNIHVRGYKEEGTTTTPFDMCVLNEVDRFSLAIDAIDRVPQLGSSAAHVRQGLVDKIIDHKHYIRRYGEDMPEIAGWVWQSSADGVPSTATASPGAIATAGDNV